MNLSDRARDARNVRREWDMRRDCRRENRAFDAPPTLPLSPAFESWPRSGSICVRLLLPLVLVLCGGLSFADDLPVISQGDTLSGSVSQDSKPRGFVRQLSATDTETASADLNWSILSQPAHGTAWLRQDTFLLIDDVAGVLAGFEIGRAHV